MMDSAMGKKNDALGLLGFVTGLVNQELLLRKNTSWQRTAFCKPGSKDDYGHRKARRPPLRRSPNGGGQSSCGHRLVLRSRTSLRLRIGS
jgi:hypothetical protein